MEGEGLRARPPGRCPDRGQYEERWHWWRQRARRDSGDIEKVEPLGHKRRFKSGTGGWKFSRMSRKSPCGAIPKGRKAARGEGWRGPSQVRWDMLR